MLSLYEIATTFNKKDQYSIIDAITSEAPILRDLPMEESSHGLWNIYETITDITGAGIAEQDDCLPHIEIDSDLRQTDLSIIGGEMEVGEETARKMGGPAAYFAKMMIPVLRKTGMSAEHRIIYDEFRSFTLEYNKAVSAGGSSNANYTILCVHYVPGEVTGVYDADGFGDGKTFDLTPISGGNLYKNNDGRLVYGMRLKTYFGLQIANIDYVSAIVNCDISNDKESARTFPTIMMLDDLLVNAKAGQNTFIYCHPKVKSYLGSLYKLDHLSIQNNGFSTVIDAWNGVPIVTSFNFENGTEANVTF